MIASVERVLENINVCDNIYKIAIEGKYEGRPGQFYMLKALYDDPVLPRPISIYNLEDDKIEFLYRAGGKGTKLISKLKKNDMIQIMGPLGNGFYMKNIKGKIAVVTGGIGIAPMGYFIKQLKDCSVDFYGGFKNTIYGLDLISGSVDNINLTLEQDFKDEGELKQVKNKVKIVKNAYITDILNVKKYDRVFCCGPKIMMKKVVDMCVKNDVPIYVSMENKMACGIGACLVCACNTKKGYRRVCSDGPVFDGKDLIWDE